MRKQTIVKQTGEAVEIVCSLYGKVDVLYLERPKVKRNGKQVYQKGKVLLRELELD